MFPLLILQRSQLESVKNLHLILSFFFLDRVALKRLDLCQVSSKVGKFLSRETLRVVEDPVCRRHLHRITPVRVSIQIFTIKAQSARLEILGFGGYTSQPNKGIQERKAFLSHICMLERPDII